MAMISWGTLKSLLLFFGPILLPKIISFYRNARDAPRRHGLIVRPVPAKTARALAVLFSVALALLLQTLPVFSPENVFRATGSRLQTPTDVLFVRLAALRAPTARDAALRAKFVNLESRLLYLHHGPDVLADCPFCAADDPRSYLWYALPALLAPHLLNLAALALATSGALAGRPAARWRRTATAVACALAAADLYSVWARDPAAARRGAGSVDGFFWAARLRRLLALAAADAALGWLLWLSATNRAFAEGPAPAERVEAAVRRLATARGRLAAAGVAHNALVRDAGLRARAAAYWAHEVAVVGDAMEDREVVEGVGDALRNRIDIEAISRDAEVYAGNVFLPAGGAGDAGDAGAG